MSNMFTELLKILGNVSEPTLLVASTHALYMHLYLNNIAHFITDGIEILSHPSGK